jgi:hypothetical protein
MTLTERLGRMRELGEPVKANKSACPFDGVDQPEDGVEHLGIVGLLLETHELNVELIEPLAGFGHEFSQELVHNPPPWRAPTRPAPQPPRLCRGLSVNSGLRFVDHRNDFAWAGRF